MKWSISLSQIQLLVSLGLLFAASASAYEEGDGVVRYVHPTNPAANFRATTISSDGSVSTGTVEGSGVIRYEWDTGKQEPIRYGPNRWSPDDVAAITPDGSVIVGSSSPHRNSYAIVWRDGVDTLLPRPEVSDARAFARAVSNDGRVIVGSAHFDFGAGIRLNAAIWVDGVVQGLPDPAEVTLDESEATTVSADGRVVIGKGRSFTLGRVHLRWVNGMAEILEGPDPPPLGRLNAISADGLVVSTAVENDGGVVAALLADGAVEALGDLPGGPVRSRVVSMTGDARLVLGRSATGPDAECAGTFCNDEFEDFVWTPESGMRLARDWLRFGCGYDFIHWEGELSLMTRSGSHVVYSARPDGERTAETFRVDVSACRFDFDVPRWKAGPGDFYYTQGLQNAIYRVDMQTLDVRKVSAHGELFVPDEIVIGADGMLYVMLAFWPRIVRVDPETGAQELIANGGLLENPIVLIQRGDGTLFILNPGVRAPYKGSIVSLDPHSREMRLVSQGNWIRWSNNLTFGPDGSLFTLTSPEGEWWVVEIDADTGAQTPIVRLDEAPYGALTDLYWEPSREELLYKGREGEVKRIDLGTGRTSIVYEDRDWYFGVGFTREGKLLSTFGDLVRVDLATREREDILSGGQLTLYPAWDWVEVRPACDDGLDNDRDGLADAEDPGCTDTDDEDEFHRTDVTIDIAPFDDGNRIRLGHGKLVMVAVLGSEAVDPREVDSASLGFGPERATAMEGISSLIFDWFFLRQGVLVRSYVVDDTGLAIGDDEACMVGTIEGVPFEACDSVEIDLTTSCGGGHEVAWIVPLAVFGLRSHRRRSGPATKPDPLSH